MKAIVWTLYPYEQLFLEAFLNVQGRENRHNGNFENPCAGGGGDEVVVMMEVVMMMDAVVMIDAVVMASFSTPSKAFA
jgi:hypothetical protein